jgi:hypothetical protein
MRPFRIKDADAAIPRARPVTRIRNECSPVNDRTDPVLPGLEKGRRARKNGTSCV